MTKQVENFNACPEKQQANTAHLCDDVYKPENRNQFCGNNTKPEHNCNSDDDYNSYLSDNLSHNIYDAPGPKHDYNWQKSVNKGQDNLNKSSDELGDALKMLDRGDVRGAQHEIEDALKFSGKSVNQFDRAVDQHRNGGANGAYGEDGLKDGTREIKGSRDEMKQALELLKAGKTGEAYESIREAMKGLDAGGKEVQAGEDSLTGKHGVRTPQERQAAADKEFDRGAKHFDRSQDSLEDALNSLDHGDRDSALRDLERSQSSLGFGQNNIKDGLRLHPDRAGDESGVKQGLDTAKTVDQSIDAAMDLVKCGCVAEAKQMIQEAMKRLDQSTNQISDGLDKMNGNGQTCDNTHDFTPGDHQNGNNGGDHCHNGRDVNFPTDYRPSNPDWRDRLNPGNGDNSSVGLLPGEFGIKLPMPPLPGRDFNPLDPLGLFGKNGGSNFNPFDPLGLFDKQGSNGKGFNPLDPAGLFDNGGGGNNGPLDFLPKPPNPFELAAKLPNPIEELQPKNVIENITRPDKVIKKIFGGLFG